MSLLPPDTIQVKRKRGADADDGPVDFLRVEGNKRFRNLSGDANWVYQRKIINLKSTAAPPSVPVIKTSQEGDENRRIKSLRRTTTVPTATKDSISAALKAPTPATSSVATNDHVRIFHLSKVDLSGTTPTTRTSKKRGAPAVFVERGAKKRKENIEPKPEAQDVPTSHEIKTTSASVSPNTTTDTQPASQPVKYKRPGMNARTHQASAASKPTLPPSLLRRDNNIDMDELARDMEAYTLSHITHMAADLDRVERERAERIRARSAKTNTSPAKPRFKPKAPAARYAQRHPGYAAEREHTRAEVATAATAASRDHAVSDAGDSTDDDDYVLETYERVPASRLRDQAVPPHRVGLLVFDTEPERTEFFFGNEDESEDDFPEDEEDENAENYYTADYPDEDLDWDDQFDRNNYRYAKEWGAEDVEDLDDDQWDRISDDVKKTGY